MSAGRRSELRRAAWALALGALVGLVVAAASRGDRAARGGTWRATSRT